jgi:hypothetical protein
VFVGEGLVRSRLAQHAARARTAKNAQGEVFAGAGALERSWALNGSWAGHQRLELENDLIASHLLATRKVPMAQFLG